MDILSPDEMRETDRIAIEEMGIQGLDLMERAGSEIGRVIRDRIGVSNRRVVVLCGKGNNGGDGLVVARWLSARGVHVEVLLFCDGKDLQGDAAANFALIRDLPIPLHQLPDDSRDSFAAERIASADVLVDALLGTGFSGAPRGRVADAIRLIDKWPGVVVSVDVPSGVNGKNGAVEGVAVRAGCTVTLCRPKQGLYLYPGRAHTGFIITVPIGIPEEALERAGARAFLFETKDAARLIKPRARDAHKGHFGRIILAGGSPGMTGAPLLAGMAALRSGGGLVTLGVPASLQPQYGGRVLELMTFPLEDQSGCHTGEGARLLLTNRERFDVLGIGPGFGRGEGQNQFVDEILSGWRGAVVVDADAIHALAGRVEEIHASGADLILTPHAGEMRSLTGVSREEILSDRVAFVRKWAVATGSVLLLKGNPTLVGDPDGGVSLNTTGNPGMATAGSGDVLTGTISAMLGAGIAPSDAARLAVWIHGRAGDIVAESKGEAGLIAGDIIDGLSDAIAALERKAEVGS